MFHLAQSPGSIGDTHATFLGPNGEVLSPVTGIMTNNIPIWRRGNSLPLSFVHRTALLERACKGLLLGPVGDILCQATGYTYVIRSIPLIHLLPWPHLKRVRRTLLLLGNSHFDVGSKDKEIALEVKQSQVPVCQAWTCSANTLLDFWSLFQ